MSLDAGSPGLILSAVVYEAWWVQILKSVVLFGIAFTLIPLVLLAERKLLGRFHGRIGPNRVGPFGTMQPAADILKLLTKEQFRPASATAWLFVLAPVLAMATALATFMVVPFSGRPVDILGVQVGLWGVDTDIGILLFFAVGAVGFYGTMLGGWASGSKYAFLGAMRSAAQLVSFEVSQGLALLGVVMSAGTLSLTGIVEQQEQGVWFVLPQIVGFFCFFCATLAEINRGPFEQLEADAELVAGFMTEFGGGRFAAYYVTEYMHLIVAGAIISTLFLGGWNIPFVDPPTWVDPIVVAAKTAFVVFVIIWFRASLPRMRYDQVMAFGWKVLLPLATLNALVSAVLLVVL